MIFRALPPADFAEHRHRSGALGRRRGVGLVAGPLLGAILIFLTDTPFALLNLVAVPALYLRFATPAGEAASGGRLNDIAGNHVTAAHVREALADGLELTLAPTQIEWLLQVLNDVRLPDANGVELVSTRVEPWMLPPTSITAPTSEMTAPKAAKSLTSPAPIVPKTCQSSPPRKASEANGPLELVEREVDLHLAAPTGTCRTRRTSTERRGTASRCPRQKTSPPS